MLLMKVVGLFVRECVCVWGVSDRVWWIEMWCDVQTETFGIRITLDHSHDTPHTHTHSQTNQQPSSTTPPALKWWPRRDEVEVESDNLAFYVPTMAKASREVIFASGELQFGAPETWENTSSWQNGGIKNKGTWLDKTSVNQILILW